MTAFRIEPTRAGLAMRVIHGEGDWLASALISAEDDGTLCLFPVDFDPPAPLTGDTMRFPDLAAVEAFLGIAEARP